MWDLTDIHLADVTQCCILKLCNEISRSAEAEDSANDFTRVWL